MSDEVSSFEKYKDKPFMRFQIACRQLHSNIKSKKAGNADGRGYKYCDLHELLNWIYAVFTPLSMFVRQYSDYSVQLGSNLIKTDVLDLVEKKSHGEYGSESGQSTIASCTMLVPNHQPIAEAHSKNPAITNIDQFKVYGPGDGSQRNTQPVVYSINKELGASITYIRKYSLFTLLNIYPEADTDGEGR